MIKNTREERKTEQFYQVVKSHFSYFFKESYDLVEFCAGNGNGGKIFLQNGDAKQLHLVDVKTVRKLEETLVEIDNQATIFLEGIDNYQFSQKQNIAIIGIHACGELTDKIIEKAVTIRAPVAVMPCCYSRNKKYNLQQPLNPRLLLYQRKEDYFDLVRLQFLKEQRYFVALERIDSRITPMNNVLIGIPYKSNHSISTKPQTLPV